MSLPSTSRKSPNPWWVGFVCGMATLVDAAALTAVGTALVLYQTQAPDRPGITADQIGLLTAALTLSVAVGSLVGGRLGDRYGRRKVFISTMLLIFLGSLTTFIGISFPALLVGITLLGLGVGADLPVAIATIAETASDNNRGKILVFSNILGGVGIGCAVVLGIVFGGAGIAGGQAIFAFFGVLALVVVLLRLTIPESHSWRAAVDEQAQGIRTVRANKASLRDLMRPPYRRPLLVIGSYYTLVGLAVTTIGSFTVYIAYNVAHVPIQEFSTASLVVLPLAVLAQLWFMAVADGRHRMSYFVVGAALVVVAFLVPVVGGFNLVTMVGSTILMSVAGAFCYETIMKVWTQESFPVRIRSTAQGAVYAISRLFAAALAAVTPALLAYDPAFLYVGGAVVAFCGFAIAFVGMRKVRNAFHDEQLLDEGAAGYAQTPAAHGAQAGDVAR